LGFVPDDVTVALAAAVARLSQRLGIPVGELRATWAALAEARPKPAPRSGVLP
jgi:hypothetical protein